MIWCVNLVMFFKRNKVVNEPIDIFFVIFVGLVLEKWLRVSGIFSKTKRKNWCSLYFVNLFLQDLLNGDIFGVTSTQIEIELKNKEITLSKKLDRIKYGNIIEEQKYCNTEKSLF